VLQRPSSNALWSCTVHGEQKDDVQPVLGENRTCFSDLPGTAKKISPLKNFAVNNSYRELLCKNFTRYLPVQLVANVESFIALSTEFTKPRCF